MVRNEADVLGANIEHLFAQGVDGITILDHGSTDGTPDIAVRLGCDVIHDRRGNFAQGEKLTGLARELLSDWIIPFDADEIWHAPEGTLTEWLGTVPPEVSVVQAQVLNHVPTGQDVEHENPFLRMPWRHRQPTGVKVAFRPHPRVRLGRGSHSVNHPAGKQIGGLCVRHFSARSFEQYQSKIAGSKGHDRLLWVLRNYPEEFSKSYWNGIYVEVPGPDLVWDPAPFAS